MSPRSAFDLLLLAALWGASFLFMRISAPEFGPAPMALLRVVGGGMFLLPILLWRGQWPALRSRWRDIGQATTHWDKLQHRVQHGVGNPCPLVLIGLPASMIRFDAAKVDTLEDDEISP